MKAGFSPQLTLTAAILRRGGFAEVGPVAPGELTYVRVSGARDPAARRCAPTPRRERRRWPSGRWTGLTRRDRRRSTSRGTPYVSWAAPQFMGRYDGDYDHLARLWEWDVIGDDEEGAE